jgi:hypothetical protein
MRAGALAPILIWLLFASYAAAAQTPGWTRVSEHAGFSPRDTASGAVFLGRMWISNGYPDLHDLWSSRDGVEWTKVLDRTPYDPYSALVVHDGKLWAIKNSVWFSRNGVDWTRAIRQVPFRISSDVVEYRGRMWALGSGSEVWSSADGTRWVCSNRRAPFGQRAGAALAVFNDTLWLLGGATPAPHKGYPTEERKGYPNLKMNNDIWSSTDGSRWTPLTGRAPWTPRMWFVATEYAGRLWIVAGYNNDSYVNLADAWSTADVVHWQQEKSEGSWPGRHEPTGVVFDRSLWLIAGNSWPTLNDVWKLTLPDGGRPAKRSKSKEPLHVVADTVPASVTSRCNEPDALCRAAFTAFDTASVNAGAKGFSGAAFDGRYIYFAPNHDGENYSGLVTRYDTTASFTKASSWRTYDATAINKKARGFFGAVFDGRYVYFVPDEYGTSGLVTRYDTAREFSSPASWSVYDTAAQNPKSTGFRSAVFDGRYLYLIPYKNSKKHESHGLVVRYDTIADFKSPASWSFFDTSSVDANATGFIGAVFDGRYVYLVPTHNGEYFGEVARYDTSLPFASRDAWSVFNTVALNAKSKGFVGAVFDGRYVYFVPYHNAEPQGQVTRYDTKGSFVAPTSWRFYDTTAVDPSSVGFTGGVSDGRYVYFVPNNRDGPHGHLLRYDTEGTFSSARSWRTFDLTSVNPAASGFHRAVFDGRYVYFVPYNNGAPSGLVVRLATDGRTPSPLMAAEHPEAAAGAIPHQAATVEHRGVAPILRSPFVKTGTHFEDIGDLGAQIGAGETYSFDFTGFVTASRDGGYQFTMQCTCEAASVAYEILAVDNGTNAITLSSSHTALGGNDGGSGSTDVFVRISGTITANTSGILSPQFAQEVEDGKITLLPGSRFQAVRIAP